MRFNSHVSYTFWEICATWTKVLKNCRLIYDYNGAFMWDRCLFKILLKNAKICRYTGFLWPAFSRIRIESTIMSLYGKIRVRENPYSDIFYAVSYKRIFFVFLGFWNGVLLLTTGASAGLDIYKQELGCKKETPQLQKNVNKIDRKQAELVEMKDDINLRWIPGKYLFILARKENKNWI